MTETSERTWRFGVFSLHVKRRELTRSGQVVALQPKLFDLLLFLVEHHERVVSREELETHLWSDEDGSAARLTTAVRRLRRALGNGAADVVRAVYGQGYRIGSRVYRVTLPRGVVAPDSEIIGRDAEMRTLGAAFEEVAPPTASLFLVSGEPGVGKSRLCERFVADRAGEALVFRGRCHADASGLPCWPWAQIARSCLSELGGEIPSRDRSRELEAALSVLVPEALAPALPASRTSRPAWPLVLEGIARLIERAAGGRTVIVSIEDLHHADHRSLALLDGLARRRSSMRLFILSTYRDTSLNESRRLASFLRSITTAPRFRELLLAGLDDKAILAVASHRHNCLLSDDETVWVRRATNGNPAYLGLLLNGLAGGAIAINRPLNLSDDTAVALESRLARLSPSCRQLLSVASVLGYDFGVDLMRRVARRAKYLYGAATPARFSKELEVAMAARLLDFGDGRDRTRCRFAHGMLRDLLYGQLSVSMRSQLHNAVAEELRGTGHSGTNQLSDWADHTAHASWSGATSEALSLVIEAADQAQQVADDETATRHYRQALELLRLLPETDRGRERYLLEQLAASHRRNNDLVAAAALEREARDLVEKAS